MTDDDPRPQSAAEPRPSGAVPVPPPDVALNPGRLAVFCAVVERHSFTRAADDLSFTQPAVSMHVRSLEDALGARLFDRGNRGAQLTPAGQAVYDYAVGVLRDTVALHARLDELAGRDAGVVTLGTTTTPGTYILPGLLARFHHQQPGAQVRLRILTPDAISQEVLAEHLDFGVVSETTPVAQALRSEPLWTERLVLVAAPDHRLAARPRVALADLAGEEFIAGPHAAAGDLLLDAALARAGLPPRRIALEVGHPEAARQAVLASVGLAVLLHRVVAAELAAGQLVALDVDDLPLVKRARLVYRRTYRFSALARDLLACFRASARQPARTYARAR